MDDKFWEAIAEMFRVANQGMVDMTKTVTKMTSDIKKGADNPFKGLPDAVIIYQRRKSRQNAAQIPWGTLKYKPEKDES